MRLDFSIWLCVTQLDKLKVLLFFYTLKWVIISRNIYQYITEYLRHCIANPQWKWIRHHWCKCSYLRSSDWINLFTNHFYGSQPCPRVCVCSVVLHNAPSAAFITMDCSTLLANVKLLNFFDLISKCLHRVGRMKEGHKGLQYEPIFHWHALNVGSLVSLVGSMQPCHDSDTLSQRLLKY